MPFQRSIYAVRYRSIHQKFGLNWRKVNFIHLYIIHPKNCDIKTVKSRFLCIKIKYACRGDDDDAVCTRQMSKSVFIGEVAWKQVSWFRFLFAVSFSFLFWLMSAALSLYSYHRSANVFRFRIRCIFLFLNRVTVWVCGIHYMYDFFLGSKRLFLVFISFSRKENNNNKNERRSKQQPDRKRDTYHKRWGHGCMHILFIFVRIWTKTKINENGNKKWKRKKVECERRQKSSSSTFDHSRHKPSVHKKIMVNEEEKRKK